MAKNILIAIVVFFNITACVFDKKHVNEQNLPDIYYFDNDILFSSFLSKTQEINRIERYSDGSFIIQEDYVTEDNKTTVYSRDIQRDEKPHIWGEYIFDNTTVESNYYYSSGYRYYREKHTYLDGLLKTFELDQYGYGDGYGEEGWEEYEDEYNKIWNSDKYEYFYDSDKNLVREVCDAYEKKYSYSAGKLILIEYFFRTGDRKDEYKSEKVEYIGGNITYSPCYDFYIKPPYYLIMDKKVIENKLDRKKKTTTTTIKYFHRNGQIYQKTKYIFVNDRIESIKPDRYIDVYPNKIRVEKEEYKYFYN